MLLPATYRLFNSGYGPSAYSQGVLCAGGTVLGHDRYGRLLCRIVETVGKLSYAKKEMVVERQFHFRPEGFLFGDIYFLGFEMNQCEIDLW